MRTALVLVLVVAGLVMLFYAWRAQAETPPEPELPSEPEAPPPPAYAVQPPTAPAPTMTLERTAEETWRANVTRAATVYRQAMEAYALRFPTIAGRALAAARAIEAAAPMETRAHLMFRIGFASRPPAGAGAALRAWDALVAAIRAPIEFRPTDRVVVVPGVVPLGELTV